MPDLVHWYKLDDMDYERLTVTYRTAWTTNGYVMDLDSIFSDPLAVDKVTRLLQQGPVWIKHRKTGEVNHIWKISQSPGGFYTYYLDGLEPASVAYVQAHYTLMENHD